MKDIITIHFETLLFKICSGGKREEFFKLKEYPAAQSKVKEKPSPSPAGQEVRKIINFVAITSRQVVEGYKPRNKLKLSTAGSGSKTIKQPERVERKRRSI